MVRTILCWSVLFLCLTPGGCDFLDPAAAEEEPPQVVVESYQVAGEPLKKIRLIRPVSIDSSFRRKQQGITDADVRVKLLDGDGSVVHSYAYRATGSGVYVPEDSAIVQPGRTYRLETVVPELEQPVTSETTVPDTFSITKGVKDSLIYQNRGAFSFRITSGRSPSREKLYMISTYFLPPYSPPTDNEMLQDFLTPRAKKLVRGTDNPAGDDSYSPNSLRGNEWPPVSASAYTQHDDGTLSITHPWKNISFFGQNRITVRLIDENWYDFIRSHDAQQGSGSPAEIPNVIDHVTNGTGVFASCAKVGFEVVVTRK